MDGEVDTGLDYSDLFGSGTGFDLEGRMLWKSIGTDWLLGGFLSIGRDSYDGQRDTDDFGDSLTTDDLDITTIIAGFKGSLRFGDGFHFGAHGGLGMASYSKVEGVLRVDFGPPLGLLVANIEVFGASSAFVFDLGAHLGYTIDHFFAEIGFGLRFQGAPDGGDLDFDTGAPAIATFELGAGVRF